MIFHSELDPLTRDEHAPNFSETEKYRSGIILSDEHTLCKSFRKCCRKCYGICYSKDNVQPLFHAESLINK